MHSAKEGHGVIMPAEISPNTFREKIEITDAVRQMQAYFIYKRLKWGVGDNYRQLFIEQTNQGFVYLLRFLVVKATGIGGIVTKLQQPFFNEMFAASQLKNRQTDPIPPDLLSSPVQYGIGNYTKSTTFPGGSAGVYYSGAPKAVDQSGYGVNATAQAFTSLKFLNYFYVSGDAIRVDFTTTLNLSAPAYLDCMLGGYYIPDRALDYWKGAL